MAPKRARPRRGPDPDQQELEDVHSTASTSTATVTLRLRPSHPVGLAIQCGLFFASDTWIDVLHRDVDALLSNFVEVYSGSPSSSSVEARSGGESPFEVFKRVWVALGWTHIHLLGVLDGPVRRPWAESIFRAFLERLRENEEPLRQVAALFAIYTFYSTQAKTHEHVYVPISPGSLFVSVESWSFVLKQERESDALDYLRSLPISLASSISTTNRSTTVTKTTEEAASSTSASPPLDPTLVAAASSCSSSPASPPHPALDLSSVVASLVTQKAFFIVPEESYNFPPVPGTSVRDIKKSKREEMGKLVLGIEHELSAISSGTAYSNSVATTTTTTTNGDQVIQGQEQQRDDDEDKDGWVSTLKETQSQYLQVRTSRFPNKRSPLLNTLLTESQRQTLLALKDASPSAETVVPGITGAVAEQQGRSSGQSETEVERLGLFRLVGDKSNRGGLETFLETISTLKNDG